MSVEEIPLSVPDIGDAEKIELVTWKIQEGENVRADQELCELVTDKAAFPLESPFDGKIIKILRKEGELVCVGDTLVVLEKS
ncbi:MAG: hypothetical protein OEZ34_00180 [Spirochaetia bacterium]|nr:hypothetical protein [Spirochaetia bacterium]